MKVLVIDDDRSVPVEVSAMLLGVRWPNSTVLTAQTGDEGWRLFQHEAPHIVLLNVAVPGGRDVLRDIRQLSSVPVLLVVDRAGEQDLVHEFEPDADDYVTKPLRGLRLVELLVLVILRRGGDVPTASEPEWMEWVRTEGRSIAWLHSRWRQPRAGFRQFLKRARTALAAARDEARDLGSPSIWAEHLLLGVIRTEADSTVPRMLYVQPDRARSVVASRLGRKEPVPDQEPELSLQAKRVLERSMVHADRRGHAGVDLEHLLLGLLEVLEESERPTLRALELDPKDIREIVEQRLGPGGLP